MENFTGRIVGKYHIVEQLGTGGMAVVYKAFDTTLERPVAIKFIRRETIGEQYFGLLQQRFEREARVLASLDHPNIVTILEYGQFQGSPYLVMKYIPCGALRTDGRPVPYERAARLLLPVARALEYAHRRGVIHRDLKPSNILICENGDPTLSDFGIAKILDAPADGSGDGLITSLTGTGLPIGTPEYMAPEQWQGKPCAQSDIYGLGVVLYELLTGRRPYTADTPAAVMIKQVTEPLPRPRDFARDLPEEVEHILFKALALKPENRYAAMGDFVRALEHAAAKPAAPAVIQPAAVPPAVMDPAQAAAAPKAVDQPKAAAVISPVNPPEPVAPVTPPAKVIATDYGARAPATVTEVDAPVLVKAPGAGKAPAAAPAAAGRPAAALQHKPTAVQAAPAPGKARRPAVFLLLGGAGIGLVVVLLLIGWVVSGVLGSARAQRTATPAAAATAAVAAPIDTATATATDTLAAITPSPTLTGQPTFTPRPTQTETAVSSPTAAVSPTAAAAAPATAAPTRTSTLAPVIAATNTPRPAPTSTPKPAPTNTPKPAPTNTPLPPAPSATSAVRPTTPAPP